MWVKTAVGVGVAVLLVCSVLPFCLYDWPETANAFGDSFGFVNAVASALAFAAVAWTLLLQRRSLDLQSKELEDMQRLQLLTARMSALTALLPDLPKYRFKIEEGEISGTPVGLFKEAAQIELEFLLGWTANRCLTYAFGEGAPDWRTACQLLDGKIHDAFSQDIDINERQCALGFAIWVSRGVKQNANCPSDVRDVVEKIESLLYSASYDLTAQGKIGDDFAQQIDELQLQLLKPCS